MWMIAKMIHFLGDIFFPPQCLGCRKKEEVLCAACISHARRSLASPSPFILSHFDFKDPVIRQAIHAMKYYHRRDLVSPLVLPLKEQLQQIPNVKSYVLVPVPMPRGRKLLRGFNQAELIAHELGKEFPLSVRTDVLVRNHSSSRQVRTKSKIERTRNQKGSFRVVKDVTGLRVLLVDDVTTTGATLAEARKTLLAMKAANVLAITLAH